MGEREGESVGESEGESVREKEIGREILWVRG